MIKQPVALLTGNGMDTARLSEFLLNKNYKVNIITRRSGSSNNWRLKEIGIDKHPNLRMDWCDITEYQAVSNIIKKIKPDELYHLAAQSFVASSFTQPITTMQANTIGYLNILEVLQDCSPHTKIYFAASSEMYGKVQETPQNEKTPFYPRSPYGVSKLSSYWLGINYRESYNMFISNGILFNHEDLLRGEEFVTRKITMAVAKIYKDILENKKVEPLVLGNIYAKRDWGASQDYVTAMWMMLQQPVSDDFVIATGKTWTIKQFVIEAFNILSEKIKGYGITWYNENEDIKEYAVDSNDNVVLKISEEFFRPADVELLRGDSTKAKNILGWEPKIKFKELVRNMLDADIRRLS